MRSLIFVSFFFYCVVLNTAHAQVSPLAIDSNVPDIPLSHLYNDPVSSLRLSDFKGKAILIDFWATWCSPCVASLKSLDSLQSAFDKDLEIICVTSEKHKIVQEVISRLFPNKRPGFLMVLNDSLLVNYFPHQTIPHCIFIDKNGKVRAITDKSGITNGNIEDLINGNALQIANKPQIIKYDKHKPPYASKQLELEDEFLYHSMVTKYRDGLSTGYSRGINDDFISCINSPIIRLYQCAFGKFDLSYWDMNRVICKGFTTFADSVKIGIFKSKQIIESWHNDIQTNAFSYELATNGTKFTHERLFEIMGEDLNRYFETTGFKAHLEKRQLKVVALREIDSTKNYRSDSNAGTKSYYSTPQFLKVEKVPMSFFLSQLEPYMHTGNAAVINETGFDGNISVDLNGKLDNMNSLNDTLFKYGLKFVEKLEPTDVIVIEKTKSTHP